MIHFDTDNNFIYWNDRNQLEGNSRYDLIRNMNQVNMRHFQMNGLPSDEVSAQIAHENAMEVPQYMRQLHEYQSEYPPQAASFFDKFSNPATYDEDIRDLQQRIARTNLVEYMKGFNPQMEQEKQQYLSRDDKQQLMEKLADCVSNYQKFFSLGTKYRKVDFIILCIFI